MALSAVLVIEQRAAENTPQQVNYFILGVTHQIHGNEKNLLLSDYEKQFHILQLTTSRSYTALEFIQKQNRPYV